MKNLLKKRGFLVVLFLAFFVFSAKFVYAAGDIVPCGGPTEDVCTICHLFLGIWNLINWIRDRVLVVGLFIITVAGLMWIVSGDLAKMAKDAIKSTLIAIIVMFAAWIIIFLLLDLISYKEGSGTVGDIIKRDGWNFSCSTDAFVGGKVTGIPGTGGGKNEEEPKCAKFGVWCNPGQMTTAGSDGEELLWKCSLNGKTISCRGVSPDGEAECGSSKNTCEPAGKASVGDVWKEGDIWKWKCVSKNGKKSVTCSYDESKKDLENLFTLQPDAKKRKSDASPELVNLLNCVAGKLPQKAVISSISDGANGVNCYVSHPEWPQCSKTIKTNCCAHKKGSCHYGGTCGGKSYAVDFVGSLYNRQKIASAIKECNGGAYTLQETNPEHLHASIGGSCNCN